MSDRPVARRWWLIAGLAVAVAAGGAILVSSPGNRAEELGFHQAGLMSESCGFCHSLMLDDGRIFVLTSSNSGGFDGFVIEIFDPDTWQFTRVAEEEQWLCANVGCYSALLSDGRVLIVGGQGLGMRLFDPQTSTLTSLDTDGDQWRGAQESLVLHDGRTLFTGWRRVAVFDPATETMSRLTSLTSDSLPLVPLPDGRVMILTSVDGGQVFDPTDDSLTPQGSALSLEVKTHAPLGDGRYLLTSALDHWASVFDPATLSFTRVDQPAETVGVLIELDNGSVLAGPDDSLGDFENDRWMVFDPDTDTFLVLNESRYEAMPAIKVGSRVLLFGSEPGSTFVFDPDTNRFEEGPSHHGLQNPVTFQPLDDKRILILGEPSPAGGFFGTGERRDALASERARSSEVLVEEGARTPRGCCPIRPGDTYLTIRQPITTEQVARLADGRLGFVMTAPLESLTGAAGIGYLIDGWSIDLGPHPEARFSGSSDPPTGGCASGCAFVMGQLPEFGDPIPAFTDGRLISTWDEFLDEIELQVVIIYDGPAPENANQITLTIP